MSALPVEYPLAPLPSRDAVVLPFPSHRVRPTERPRRTAPARRLRPTRRGRLTATFVGVAVVAVLLTMSAAAALPAGGAAGEQVSWSSSVVVLPGQTLWDVASDARPGADIRETIAEIRALNDLPTSGLTAGQVLLVPVVD